MSEAKIAQLLAILGAVFEQLLGESDAIKEYIQNIGQTEFKTRQLDIIRESEKEADKELIDLLTLELEQARGQQQELIEALAKLRSAKLDLETIFSL